MPNPFMTTAQFAYKVATIYETKNTCFIVPLLDKFDRLVGYYPVNPHQVEVVDVKGAPYLRFTFGDGKKLAVELARCGVVSKYLYNSDIKGEDNAVLKATMQLLHTQNQGIEEGIKNSASFRFMAQMANLAKESDRKKVRDEVIDGLKTGGFALFPGASVLTNLQQIQSHAQIVDPEQMQIIQTRVLNYFGCNEDVLQNKTIGDAWSAYYEGKIEPFSVQLSLAMTCMTYSHNERARGNAVHWNANRLQYMSNPDKLNWCTQMFDRGMASLNDCMAVFNMPPVPDGDKRYIRKEYTEISQLDAVADLQEQLTAMQNQLNASKPKKEEQEDDPEHQDEAQE
jgi:hypothetical protein